MTCSRCAQPGHDDRAHLDPEAALEAGDEAKAAGRLRDAMAWYELARTLANRQRRGLRGLNP